MKSKDQVLLEEAYISAMQKTVNVPTDSGSADIPGNEIPELNSPSTELSAPSTEPQVTISLEPSDVSSENEESEEMWMVRSNLFSLFTNAKKIHQLSMTGMDLDPWMQQKIAVCADNLEAVMKAAAYEAAEKGMSC